MGDDVQRLLSVTEDALSKGIENAREGRRLNEVCAAIQDEVESNGFSVVREFVGHGVGHGHGGAVGQVDAAAVPAPLGRRLVPAAAAGVPCPTATTTTPFLASLPRRLAITGFRGICWTPM